MKTKYLALDIGNVLCKMTPKPFIEELAKEANLSIGNAWKFFKQGQTLHDIGLISMRQELEQNFGLRPYAIDKLLEYWENILEIDHDMFQMVIDFINEKNIKIALLSNMGDEHKILMYKKLQPIYDFSIKHLSCDVGARKPSKLYYQSFLWDNPEFKGCLYVDDLSENIEAGKNAGFQSFQFSIEDENKLEKIKQIKNIIQNQYT